MGGQQAFPGAVVLGLCRQHFRLQAGGQPGAHIQAYRALPFGQQVHVLALGLAAGIGVGDHVAQRLPQRHVVQVVQGQRRWQPQQLAGRGIGQAHLLLGIDH